MEIDGSNTDNEMVHVQFENTNFGCMVGMQIAKKIQNDPVYRSSFFQSLTSDLDDPVSETAGPVSDASSKMDGCRWAGKEAEALVGLRIESDLKFQLNKTHKKLWEDISQQMKLNHGYTYTGVQCQNKWKSIKREYKGTVDHNAKSGNDRKTCKFFTEFNNLYGNKPSTRPAFVLDTSNDSAGSSASGKKKSACTTSTSIMKPNTTLETCTNSTSSTSESSSSSNKPSTAFQTLSSDSDESPQAPVSKKNVQEIPGRKRKNRVSTKSSGSGVDKIIGWMNSYQEKQEEMETRRFKFIKKQNKEKLDRLDRLLDIISDNRDNKQDKQDDSDSSA